jgi:hypothetical protein
VLKIGNTSNTIATVPTEKVMKRDGPKNSLLCEVKAIRVYHSVLLADDSIAELNGAFGIAVLKADYSVSKNNFRRVGKFVD